MPVVSGHPGEVRRIRKQLFQLSEAALGVLALLARILLGVTQQVLAIRSIRYRFLIVVTGELNSYRSLAIKHLVGPLEELVASSLVVAIPRDRPKTIPDLSVVVAPPRKKMYVRGAAHLDPLMPCVVERTAYGLH